MSNDLIAVLLACALAVGGLSYGLNGHRTAQAALVELDSTKSDLATERRLRAADQAAVASTTKQLNALKAQKGKQDVQLKAALVAEREWADAPVPDGVRAVIRVRHATND